MAEVHDCVRFALLGPIGARRLNEAALDVGPPQQQAMLAALAVTPGVAVSMGRLVDALWGDEMPAKAASTVRTYAWRLRRSFAGPCDGLLVSAGDGYLLAVDRRSVDATHAEDLARRARGEFAAGDPRQARQTFTEALGLWSGEPLAGVPGLFAERNRDRLTDLHAAITEQYLEAELQLANYPEAHSRLTEVIADNPLRERPYGLLMRALYGMGRQVDALEVFQSARRLLVETYGVEPGAELAELHERILRGDGDVAPPAPGVSGPRPAATPAPASTVPIPAQLPPDLPDFTGRLAQTATLEAVLTEPDRRSPAVVAIIGMSGVGKTSLAIHVAHRVRACYPDGQLYIDVEKPGDCLPELLLASLGIPADRMPATAAQRTGLFRSLMDGRRMLILLNDAADAEQVRDALPGAPGCAVMVTTRTRMDELPLSAQLTLGVFDEAEALDLLGRRIGPKRLAAEQADAFTLVDDCGRLPLAIRIVASRLAARPQWTVRSMADRLRDRRRRITELRAGSLTLEAVFEVGYGQLTDSQAHDFALLAAVAGADFTPDEAAAVLDLDRADAERRLESLADLAMLEEPSAGFFRYHELLHAFAMRRGRDPIEQADALDRLLAHLLATSSNARAHTTRGDARPTQKWTRSSEGQIVHVR